jgi:hypothetical protein
VNSVKSEKKTLLAVKCYYGYFCDNHYNIGEKIACQREFLVQDPDGYLLRFSQYIE